MVEAIKNVDATSGYVISANPQIGLQVKGP